MANIVERLTLEADQRNVLDVYSATEVLDDGYVGVLGALMEGEDRLRLIGKATDVKTEEVVMVLGAKAYMETADGVRITAYSDPSKITYPIGKPVRAYRLKIGDRYKIASSAIEGVAVVDQFLVPADGAWKLAPASDLIGVTKVALKVLKADEKIFKGASGEVPAVLAEVVVEA